ncbi:MAG: hypothetical protein ACPL3A_00370 [Thermoanaerobacteraceae bacterium]
MINIVRPGEVNFIDTSKDIEAECKRYGELLRAEPIDIVCLCIGKNSNIPFNEFCIANFNDLKIVKIVKNVEISCKQQIHEGVSKSLKVYRRTQ